MNVFKGILILLVIGCAASANADDLVSYGDGSQGTEWVWNFEENRLTILIGNGNEYKFWIHDGTLTPGSGEINNIVVASGVTGDFTVDIRHTSGGPGAAKLNAASLVHPVSGNTATLKGLVLDTATAGNGDIGASGPVTIDELDGPLTVNNLKNIVTITSVTAAAREVDPILIENNLEGELYITSDAARDIHILNDVGNATDPAAGVLQIGGDLKANLDIDDVLYGEVAVVGSVRESADFNNHVWITQMVDGYFSCVDMDLMGEQAGDDTWRSALLT